MKNMGWLLLLLGACNAFGDGRNVLLSSTSVPPGGTLTVYWNIAENASKDTWIGLYVIGADAALKDTLLWSQKSEGKSGKALVTLPSEPGQYEFRLFPSATA